MKSVIFTQTAVIWFDYVKECVCETFKHIVLFRLKEDANRHGRP